jgi:hypothetical protein
VAPGHSESTRIEVASSDLAADLAGLLRATGYEHVAIDDRFLSVERASWPPDDLDELRLSALLDLWCRRHDCSQALRVR